MTRVVFYDDNSGVEIDGNADALRELSDELVKCDGISQLPLAGPTKPDIRAVTPASVLKISIRPGPVAIRRFDRELLISGAKDKLLILAQNVSSLADNAKSGTSPQISDHIHVEYYPGHFFLAADSLPLIVTRED